MKGNGFYNGVTNLLSLSLSVKKGSAKMKWIISFFILWLISVLFDTDRYTKSSSHSNLQNEDDQKKVDHPIIDIQKAPERKLEEQKNISIESLVLEYGPVFEVTENDLSLNQNKIKKIIERRNIKQLVHFTRYENLIKIMEYGLLTRSELNFSGLPFFMNDHLRLDGYDDSISLSISFPNYKMFYKYRMNTNAKGWVVLTINPDVLWEQECAFCKHNAADSRIYNLPKIELTEVKSFEEMFSEDENNFGIRSQERLGPFDPTDPQAEVLVFGNIQKDKISYFCFDNSFLLHEFKSQYPNVEALMANQYFNTRSYVRQNG